MNDTREGIGQHQVLLGDSNCCKESQQKQDSEVWWGRDSQPSQRKVDWAGLCVWELDRKQVVSERYSCHRQGGGRNHVSHSLMCAGHCGWHRGYTCGQDGEGRCSPGVYISVGMMSKKGNQVKGNIRWQ